MFQNIALILLVAAAAWSIRARHNTNKLLRKIAMTQDELKQELEAQTAKITKIGGETRTLLQKIEDLTRLLEAGGNVTPEVQAALDALKAQTAVVDELVPDAP